MKKIILLIALFYCAIVFAQDSCSSAQVITAGMHTVATIDGPEGVSLVCTGNQSATNAEWFRYTPTNNYTITVSTDLDVNAGGDTRFQVYSGSCDSLVCHSGDDDGGSGFLSVASFTALAGTTYYIVFDNRWSSDGFDFELTEGVYVAPLVSFVTTPINSTGTYKNCVVDMNGDYLDDVVAISENQIHINFQQSSGEFIAQEFTTTNADFLPSWSIAAGDIDDNGYNDLMYGAGNGVTFMKANHDGSAYLETSGPEYVFSQRTNFVDINNDGYLDAFVCHDVGPNQFYLNDGNGSLIHNQGGLGDSPSGGNYASLWTDYDNDGDIDLFLSKCNGGGAAASARYNQLYQNDGFGNYNEVSESAGLNDPIQTWSSAWGDFDNDGWMDVFVGASTFIDGSHKLMHNNQDGTFTDITNGSGIDTFTDTGIEHITHDFNNDGYLDIFTAGNKILINNQDLTFTEANVYFSVGAVGDLNDDGFLDVFNSNGNWYRNEGNSNNWIKVNTIGDVDNPSGSNLNGIGARVELVSALGAQIREVRSGDGFRHMSSLTTHFGLGSDTSISQVKVIWPSGIIDVIYNPEINSTLNIVEGSTLSVNSFESDNFIVYPNPTEERIFIKNIDLRTTQVLLYRINGQRVFNFKKYEDHINVHHLQAGTYILTLQQGQKIYQHKIIKE
ncbi:putative secreted protein (Por secretion system target) [Oceanihabitans sediminis]|uniref:T9SS C-terminal target domain-containing protein n=1 Tax=Oceanihabitans sediminis TaxID=1812012 RepID=A0A368P9Q7_9FLAO|nr:CRTAC1 family protein [Oceanihabitans sediminis]MDX1773194.1 FG-GAP-like repeat-containing protein [Oceanihabitans sediminis]RBP34886.1 putative secreted protein (Por secretion system target) [Oceanihabitans sediminis]RCU58529.1 T9SS C-terminal target domain-containing protein [Oceanihabitans sediminis]